VYCGKPEGKHASFGDWCPVEGALFSHEKVFTAPTMQNLQRVVEAMNLALINFNSAADDYREATTVYRNSERQYTEAANKYKAAQEDYETFKMAIAKAEAARP
jgi:hypothetical protein